MEKIWYKKVMINYIPSTVVPVRLKLFSRRNPAGWVMRLELNKRAIREKS